MSSDSLRPELIKEHFELDTSFLFSKFPIEIDLADKVGVILKSFKAFLEFFFSFIFVFSLIVKL